MRGAQSEECSQRIEQEMVDAGEAFHTEAVKRPRSTDDHSPMTQLNVGPRKPDLTVTRQPKTLLRRFLQWAVCGVTPRIDLTSAAMADGWDRQIHCS